MLTEFLWCSIPGSKGIFSEAHLGRLLDMSPGFNVLVEISNSSFRGVSEVCFLAVSSLGLDVLVEILWFPYIQVSRFEFPYSSFPLGARSRISPSPLGSRSYIEISSLRALIKSG